MARLNSPAREPCSTTPARDFPSGDQSGDLFDPAKYCSTRSVGGDRISPVLKSKDPILTSEFAPPLSKEYSDPDIVRPRLDSCPISALISSGSPCGLPSLSGKAKRPLDPVRSLVKSR